MHRGWTVIVVLAYAVVGLAACSDDGHRAEVVSGYGWGSDSSGQLGQTSNGVLRTAGAVPLPAGTTAVTLGRDFTLAIARGTVHAWGRNNRGQLGDGSRNESAAPVRLDLDDVAEVAAGPHSAFAVTSGGRLYAWGENEQAQLGLGGTEPTLRPTRVSIPGNPAVAHVAASEDHVLALTRAGVVWAWGDGSSGELGTGNTTSSAKPVRVGLPDGVEVTAVAAGLRHSAAVTSDGRLLGWGSNEAGRLGLGSAELVLRPQVVASAGEDVEAVAAQSVGTLLLTSSGSVLAAGRNERGQLGDGTTTERNGFVATALPRGFAAERIAAGPAQGFAISADGRNIAAWGDGSHGALGIGSDDVAVTPELVDVRASVRGGDEKRFLDVVAGYSSAIALAEQGRPHRIAVNGPQRPVPVDVPLTLTVQMYDAAGNDLGLPATATASMRGGSCDGITCTPQRSGLQRIEVQAGGKTATAEVRVLSSGAAPAGPNPRPTPLPPPAAANTDLDASDAMIISVAAGIGLVGPGVLWVVLSRRRRRRAVPAPALAGGGARGDEESRLQPRRGPGQAEPAPEENP